MKHQRYKLPEDRKMISIYKVKIPEGSIHPDEGHKFGFDGKYFYRKQFKPVVSKGGEWNLKPAWYKLSTSWRISNLRNYIVNGKIINTSIKDILVKG